MRKQREKDDKKDGKKGGKREYLGKKMLKRTITPTIISLVVTLIISTVLTGRELMKLQNEEIKKGSQNVAYQVSEYFTKYMEISRQLAVDHEMIQLFKNLTPGERIAEAEEYASVMETMANSHETDPENILVGWAADLDSSQCIEDSGYISELGEWNITERSWYSQVMETGQTVVTEPYENSSTGEMVASIITPVKYGTTIVGVAGLDLSVQTVVTMMEEHKLGKEGFYLLLTPEGRIMYAPREDLLNTDFRELSMYKTMQEAFENRQYGSYTYRFDESKVYGYMEGTGSSQWIVLSGMPAGEYNTTLYRVTGMTVLLFAIVIALLSVVISKIARGITKPLEKLNEAAEKIAHGDLGIELDVSSRDEIGRLAASIQKTVVRLKDYIKYIDEISLVLDEIAEGDLVFTLKQDYAGEFGKIKKSLENIADTLTGTVKNINSSAEQVYSGADQIAQSAQSLADGATSQAGAIEELLATVNDLSVRVHDNTVYAGEAAQKADSVKQNIEFSNDEMKRLVGAMQEISDCSDSIRRIISNIEEIADQTNLLSLNASIEAARAGEMGKGFAVVANEVGNLAKESVEAVQTSTELIQNSLDAVQRGMNIVKGAADKLSDSVEGVVELAEKMNHIARENNHQMVGLDEIGKGIDQIAQVVTDNSAMAEESAASSEELSAQAMALNEMIGVFRVE